jgi:hypothetical protein
LPDSLRLAAQAALPPDESINSIFFVPSQSFLKSWVGQRYVPEQALLFGRRGVLHVQAVAEQTSSPRTTYLPAKGLLSARLTIMLLYGCLELVGQGSDAPVTISVEFNTVGDHLLWPPLRRLVQMAWGAAWPGASSSGTAEAMLARLRKQSYKFGNGLEIHALQSGEHPLGFVFQPNIWQPLWRFFRRKVTATTLLTLTDRQILLLEEDPQKNVNYGWIFNFFPLDCVTGMAGSCRIPASRSGHGRAPAHSGAGDCAAVD